MRNIRKKNSPLKKKDKILFAAAILLLSFAVAFFTAACVIFVKGNDDSDHSRFFTACVLLFSGGVSRARRFGGTAFYTADAIEKKRHLPVLRGRRFRKKPRFARRAENGLQNRRERKI